jgi:crotonobetainyl-CoA:carnitine CoA-transferase CaiB-like acyl-CoA transferase
VSGRAFLEGVRVLDVTAALAGPYCTTILSDLGADVVKVEPLAGDPMRARMGDGSGLSLPFATIHRNKRSLAVDLKSEDGRNLVARLAERSDVLVENFRPGAMQKLRLGYDDLRSSCPDLVYCSISGFGQTGPKQHLKGLDLISQAYGGLMSVTGSTDGTIAKAGYPVSDLGSGMWAAIGILGALLRAQAGLGGAYVDVALSDTIASWSVWEVSEFVATGEVPGPLGTAHRLAAPYQGFECKDGATLVLGAVDRLWPRLLELLGLVGLDEDARFASEYDRFKNREALAEVLGERFKTASRDEWVERLVAIGIPCGPVKTIDEIVVDEQFQARGMFVHDSDRLGYDTLVNTPVISDGAPRIRERAPRLGENTVEILTDAGYDQDAIHQLINNNVIGATAPTEAPA